jgi:hypothetical protein
MPEIEAILRAHAVEVELNWPAEMGFFLNEIRKASPHRCLVLTVCDRDRPVAVVKFGQTASAVAQASLQNEVHALRQVREMGLGDTVARVLGTFHADSRLWVVASYFPHTHWYTLVTAEAKTGRFDAGRADRVTEWLVRWTRQSRGGGWLDASVFTAWTEGVFARVSPNAAYVTDILQKVYEAFRGDLAQAVSAQVPLAGLHGDFNPYNIGWNGDDIVVMDWEDYQADQPPLFDYFYALFMVLWLASDAAYGTPQWPAVHVAIRAWHERSLPRLMAVAGVPDIATVNGLLILFLVHNLGKEAEIKRESASNLVYRWVEPLNRVKAPDYWAAIFDFFSPTSEA